MNIELARTFIEVVSCGSLSRAADRLNVTHSTVTMRIKALEDILRRRVLIRNRSGVTMTTAGTQFFRFAESLVRTWQMTRRQLSLASGFEGILSVGADATLWDDVMFGWVCKTRRERPDIAIRTESGRSDYLLQRLFQGWLDICVVYESQSRTGFTVEQLFEDPLVTASTENRQKKDHWDPDYIEIEWDDGVRAQEQIYWSDIDETPHLSAGTSALGLRFVMEFGGSVLIPRRVLASGNFPRPLYEVPGLPVFQRIAYLIYSEDALKDRLPRMGVAPMRQSLLRQLAGDTVLWDKPEPQRGRNVGPRP